MSYLYRYEALLQKQQIKYVRVENLLLREYNQIIIPLGPILNQNQSVKVNSKIVFKELKGKLLWWSYPCDPTNDDGWYGVIKERHTEVEEYSNSNLRRNVRKGLSGFEVKLVSSNFLAENGESIYKSVEKQYGRSVDNLKFRQQLNAYEGFDDIVNCWGIFSEQKLIGYCIVLLYGKQEANISETKISPDYKKHSSFALFHKLGEHYLKNLGFDYISDGYRNILHKTTIQDFLIRNFSFRKVGLQLELAFRFPWNIVVPCLHPFRSLVKSDSVSAVFQLLSIYKNQKRLPK